jgi:hypothetical protein
MSARVIYQSAFPVARSMVPRAYFFGAAAGCLVILEGIQHLRSSGELHGLAPIYLYLVVNGDYWAAMGALLILVGALFVPVRVSFRGLLVWVGEHPWAVALVSFLLMCAGSLGIYRNHPLSMDEYAAFFQSQVFASGHLAGQFPAGLLNWLIPPSFQNAFLDVNPVSGHVASGYWPAFSLLLAPFTLLGIPWACNPLISALTLVVIHRLALRIFGDAAAAGLALLFAAASPEIFANGISYYSMPAHLLANSLYALLLLKPEPRRALLAGVIGSVALTLHNPVPHILFAVPWLIWIVTRPAGVRLASWLVLGYLPLSLLLGVGWFWFLHQLIHEGMASTAFVADSASRASAFFGLPNSTIALARALAVAKIWLWTVPGLAGLAVVGAWQWRHDARLRLLASSALVTFIAFMFVMVDQGHGWGFRYFHTAWLALPLLATAVFVQPPSSVRSGATSMPGRSEALDGLRTYVVACALLTLTAGVGQRAWEIHNFVAHDLSQLPAPPGAEKRVLIVDPSDSFYGQDLIQNDPFLRTPAILMFTHGERENAAMMRHYFPGYRRLPGDLYGEVWQAGGAGRK